MHNLVRNMDQTGQTEDINGMKGRAGGSDTTEMSEEGPDPLPGAPAATTATTPTMGLNKNPPEDCSHRVGQNMENPHTDHVKESQNFVMNQDLQ